MKPFAPQKFKSMCTVSRATVASALGEIAEEAREALKGGDQSAVNLRLFKKLERSKGAQSVDVTSGSAPTREFSVAHTRELRWSHRGHNGTQTHSTLSERYRTPCTLMTYILHTTHPYPHHGVPIHTCARAQYTLPAV